MAGEKGHESKFVSIDHFIWQILYCAGLTGPEITWRLNDPRQSRGLTVRLLLRSSRRGDLLMG